MPDIPSLGGQRVTSPTPSFQPPTPPTRPAGSGITVPAQPTLRPGRMGFNVTTPYALAESTEASIESGTTLFQGLGATLFGAGSLFEETPFGAYYKEAMAGNVPDPAKAFGALAAATNPAGAIGAGLGAVDTLAKQVASPTQQSSIRVNELFEQSADVPEKAALLTELEGKSFGEQMSAKYEYLQAQARAANAKADNPALNPGMLEVPPPTLSDALKFVLQLPLLAIKPVEAAAAGVERGPGVGMAEEAAMRARGEALPAPMSRLEEIAAYERGEYQSGAFKGEEQVTEVERVALNNFRSGFWSEEEANRYLASADAGFAHDPGVEILGQVAADPTLWGSLGMAGVAGAGARAALAAEFRTATGRSLGLVGRYGAFYSADAGVAGAVGKSAKVARYIIDPLHGIGGYRNQPDPLVDIYARVAGGQMARVHGEAAYRQALNYGERLGYGSQVLQDVAAFEGIQARATVLDMSRNSHGVLGQLFRMLNPDFTPSTIVSELAERTPLQRTGDAMAARMGKFRIIKWTNQEQEMLARRVEQLYPGRAYEDVLADVAKMSDDQRNILHGATRAGAVRKVVEARARAIANGEWRHAVAPENLNLMNDSTLDTLTAKQLQDDLTALLTQAVEATDPADFHRLSQEAFQMAAVAAEQYPSTLGRATLTSAHPWESAERMRDYIGHLRDEGALPTMVELHDLPEMGYDITRVDEWLRATSSEGQRGAWKLGFMPPQDRRWGVIYDSAGKPVIAGDVWDDLVSPENVAAYMPWVRRGVNVAGHEVSLGSIPGLGRAIDGVEGALRTMTKRVSTSQIHEAAKVRFVGVLKGSGFSDGEARLVFQRLNEVAGLHRMTVRGMSAVSMWDAVEEVIPLRLRVAGGYNRRQLVLDMLEAYGGEMRFVGLTQRFTGAMKEAVARATGGNVEGANFLGQFSEDTFGKLRFRWNPGFQLQERVESPFWSVTRGVPPKLGSTLKPEERRLQAMFDRQFETSVNNPGDLADQYAYANATMGWSHAAAGALKQSMPHEVMTGLLNTAGNKQVNLLRTFTKGWGEQLKATFERRGMLDVWDDMKAQQMLRLDRSLSDDEFATMFMTENLFASEVQVERLVEAGATNQEYLQAVREQAFNIQQEMARAIDLGHQSPLELQRIVDLTVPYTKEGKKVTTVAQLMGALKKDEGIWSDLDRGLKVALEHAGFHPTQITRIENALRFDWQDFWAAVKNTYGLDDQMVKRLQDMTYSAARRRGLEGSEFLSSYFAPTIERGSDAAVQAMGGMVRFLQPPPAALAGNAPELLENLIGQMADVFIDYMDPSMMRQLGVEFLGDAQGMAFTEVSAAQLMEVMRGGTPEREQLAAIIKDTFLQRISRGEYAYGRGAVPPRAWTPRTTPAAVPADLYSHTAAHGGGTFDVATGKEMGLTRGYSVANGPLGEIVDDTPAAVNAAYERISLTGTPHIGTWRNPATSRVHVDPTEVVMDREEALALAQSRGEHAIYDHASGEDIPVPGLPDELEPWVYTARYPDRPGRQLVFADEMTGEMRYTTSSRSVGQELVSLEEAQRRPIMGAISALRSDFPDVPFLSIDVRPIHLELGKGGITVRPGEFDTVMAGTQGFASGETSTLLARRYYNDRRMAERWEAAVAKSKAGGAGTTTARPAYPGPGNMEPGYQYASLPSGSLVRMYNTDVLSAASEGIPNRGIYFGAHDSGIDLTMGTIVRVKDANLARGGRTAHPQAGTFWSKRDIPTSRVEYFGDDGAWHSVYAGFPAHYATAEPIGTIYHEFAHALDGWLRGNPAAFADAPPGAAGSYRAWVRRFLRSTAARRDLGTYARRSLNEAADPMGGAEAVAEVFLAAFTPGFDRSLLTPNTLRWVDDFKQMLTDLGLFRPGSAKPYSQGLDAAHQYFGEWLRAVVGSGLKGTDARGEFLLRSIAGIPNDMAVPYNLTESLLVHDAVAQSMQKFDNAFKLHYFDRNRRVWERSLNHQVFGVYPASYMWGKVAPELIRFIGYEPFGVRTGAMAYGMMDVQRAVMNQREYDPVFDQKVEQLGRHPAIAFLNYLMPAPVYDVGASLPGWMRSLAEQGLENERRAALGLEPKDIDVLGTSLSAAADLLNPLRGEERIKSIVDYAAGVIGGEVNPATGLQYTEAELLERKFYEMVGPVQATDLPDVLYLQQRSLQDILNSP